MWLTLLLACGTPSAFTFTDDGTTFAVGASKTVGASTWAPGRRLMLHSVPPVQNVTMVVQNPAVASLIGDTLTVHKPGETDIVVTGTVNGNTTTVTATIYAARLDHLEWRDVPHDFTDDVVLVGKTARWGVTAHDKAGTRLLTTGMNLGFPSTMSVGPGSTGTQYVEYTATQPGVIPMTGTPHTIEAVEVWDEVAELSLDRLELRHRGRRLHLDTNFGTQKSLTPDLCTVREYVMGSNPFSVNFDRAAKPPQPGCRVEITVGSHSLIRTI